MQQPAALAEHALVAGNFSLYDNFTAACFILEIFKPDLPVCAKLLACLAVQLRLFLLYLSSSLNTPYSLLTLGLLACFFILVHNPTGAINIVLVTQVHVLMVENWNSLGKKLVHYDKKCLH